MLKCVIYQCFTFVAKTKNDKDKISKIKIKPNKHRTNGVFNPIFALPI